MFKCLSYLKLDNFKKFQFIITKILNLKTHMLLINKKPSLTTSSTFQSIKFNTNRCVMCIENIQIPQKVYFILFYGQISFYGVTVASWAQEPNGVCQELYFIAMKSLLTLIVKNLTTQFQFVGCFRVKITFFFDFLFNEIYIMCTFIQYYYNTTISILDTKSKIQNSTLKLIGPIW